MPEKTKKAKKAKKEEVPVTRMADILNKDRDLKKRRNLRDTTGKRPGPSVYPSR
jgi:hypothetical protein